ncbi:MAG: 4Fe-4S binding protein [Ignavibacteria bacterium]|nr:4Fe-4S binding protein [Ignavibacteria bacterium]MBP6510643.1 4Fe-4S binding protein [Candidatus Kapabacteria bacterium]MBK7186832.1 4Fe-4S binding protein [Ignavibacteria bacterium]MBK7411774.1 4Fe-4S binding protein [Ignavibacteria bacterium]MBK7576259.1 4Fe-4S binding protein [Ignavibacteria bacterium]
MVSSLKILATTGRQTIPDVTTASLPESFRGRPVISESSCASGCTACWDTCPTSAIVITDNHVSLDLGACVFCGECADVCPEDKITFTNDHHLASNDRSALIIAEGDRSGITLDPALVRAEIVSTFGSSLKLRQVSAGGCNACELELNACGNVNFDMGRYGIEFVASPRHADGIVITGPISLNMSEANQICHDAIPDPKVVILTGACAITGGIFAKSPALQRAYIDTHNVDLYVPGCPPHPLTFINGILTMIRSRRT